MVFFLSLLSSSELSEFLAWAEEHMAKQSSKFRERFSPALLGLRLATKAAALDGESVAKGSQRFLGWTTGKHWLLS
jgi:hypothetical protein